MEQAKLDNIKINVLSEKIRDSILNGSLEKDMSIFRMEAVNIGLSDTDVQKLVDEAKSALAENSRTRTFMGKHKVAFYIVIAVVVIAEWFLPIGIGWKIALSLITIIVAIVIIAVLYVKNKRR